MEKAIYFGIKIILLLCPPFPFPSPDWKVRIRTLLFVCRGVWTHNDADNADLQWLASPTVQPFLYALYCNIWILYSARAQDGPQEMERN